MLSKLTAKKIMSQYLIRLTLLLLVTIGTLGLALQQVNACPLTVQNGQIPVDTYKIVNQYPHDQDAFTQGLIYYNGELYESTGLYGKSSLRRVELETGNISYRLPLDQKYFGEGITLWQNRIIQLTWKEQEGFVYDLNTFKKIANFYYPPSIKEGWGITHDGHNLIMSDGSDTLYFLEPYTFELINTVQVKAQETPVKGLNELEYIKGQIYANVFPTDYIARISPKTGDVLGCIDLKKLRQVFTEYLNEQHKFYPGELNGIAYDQKDNRLFVTGKLWNKLFEIELITN